MPHGRAERHAAEGVDVIVRFHDMSRLWELERAAFSLAGQLHQPVRILLMTQRFTPSAQEAVRAKVENAVAWSPAVTVSLLNYAEPVPADARSELVNLGFANASGRYVGLLDYDDVLYPEAYALLVGRLRASGAGIAFARTQVMLADVHLGFVASVQHLHPFAGSSLEDLFTTNFCPIHSYLIDRHRTPAYLLRFETGLVLEEDYDFLLRLCAAIPSDFQLRQTDIGLYHYKTDGSNTFDRARAPTPELLERTALTSAFIELRRAMTALSANVQEELNIRPPRPALTIRQFLTYRTAGGAMIHRQNNFDALRLLGALLVLVNHSMILDGGAPIGFASQSISTLGVQMFFAISGYMIALSWMRDPNPGRFALRRARRIMPALAFVVILSVVAGGLLVTTLPLAEYAAHPNTRRYLGNLVFYMSYALPGVFTATPLPNAVNGSLWTLPVEVTMYAATPLLVLLARRQAMLVLLAFLGAVAAAMVPSLGHPAPVIVYGTELWTNATLFPFFVAGAAIAGLRLERLLDWRAGLAALLLANYTGPWLGAWQSALLCVVLPYAVIAVGLARWPVVRRAGRWGDFSYGIYLWAFPFQQLVVSKTGPGFGGWTNALVSAPFILLMAAVSWYLVERPTLRFGPLAGGRAAPVDLPREVLG